MYYAIVIATTIVLPVAFTWLEYSLSMAMMNYASEGAPDPVLILFLGKWYVFFAGGARLFLAGLRQSFAPGKTLTQIFAIDHKPSEHIVQELGFANLSIGLACLMTWWFPELAPAGAVAAGLFYGLAGLQHLRKGGRNAQRTVAMVTDLLVFGVLVAYVATFLWSPWAVL